MSLDQDIYDGGEVGWLRVQSRSEATRKSKEQQRDHILNGAELFSQTPPAPKAPLDTISNPYRDLVGAPLRKRLPTQRFDTDSHHGLRNRVGGILHLPPDHPLPSQKTSGDAQSTELTFDYSDEQWPSMGSGNVVPQLTSWSTVVKKPPPPSQGPPTSGTSKETEVAHSDGEEKEGKAKKQAQKKKKREPLTFELAAVFQALELKQSKKVVMATGGGVVLPKQQKMVKGAKEDGSRTGNPLDSSAPSKRRGKEREVPKNKKPSALRKVINKEKEERSQKSGMPEATTESDGVALATLKAEDQPTKPRSIHNRRFREYCTHVVTEEINDCMEKLLTDLRNFQDRQYQKDPIKAKAKRRYVCGLREVLKHLKLKRIRCVVVPPNLDKIKSEGGINDFVQQILQTCEEQGVPAVFAMSRRRLALVLRKKHKIGCVGIFLYDGAEGHYKKLMELVATAKTDYSSQVTSHCQTTSIVEGGGNFDQDDELSSGSSVESSDEESSVPQSLNIHAREFVPSHTPSPFPPPPPLNVNAAIFTPIQS